MQVMGLQAEGMGMMDAWNFRCLPEAQALHMAYCESMIFQQISATARAAPASTAMADLLLRLASLYGCWTVQRHIGWFMTHTDMSREAAVQLDAQVDKLVRSVTMEEALSMVDAWKFPEELVSWPMARGDWLTAEAHKPNKL